MKKIEMKPGNWISVCKTTNHARYATGVCGSHTAAASPSAAIWNIPAIAWNHMKNCANVIARAGSVKRYSAKYFTIAWLVPRSSSVKKISMNCVTAAQAPRASRNGLTKLRSM